MGQSFVPLAPETQNLDFENKSLTTENADPRLNRTDFKHTPEFK